MTLAGGKAARAEAELAKLLAPDARGADSSRLSVLLRLAEAGRYGAALERAFLGALKRAEPGDRLLLEWERLFAALMCARDYDAAFRLGEAVLDKLGSFASPARLLWPWSPKTPRPVTEDRFIADELARLNAAAKNGGTPQWYLYFRVLLSNAVPSKTRDPAADEALCSLPSPRYLWMRQSFILVRLESLDFAGAAAVCRDILAHAPGHWWVRCRLAEALLCSGDANAALAQFAEAEKRADAFARREVLVWKGEILLWLGRWDEALRVLDEAVSLGAHTYVYGWRGAARLKRGDMEGALQDLDRAVELDAKDFEARAWRAEAWRLAGREDAALKELDALAVETPYNQWVYFNRGLLRDGRALQEDYARLHPFTVPLERLLGREPATPDDMRKVLETGLSLSKGIRRWERYVQDVWLQTGTESGGQAAAGQWKRPAKSRPLTK